MDIWHLILEIILTGVALLLYGLAYRHIDKAPITEPWLKWGLQCIPVIIVILVIGAIWGMHLPESVH